MTKVTVAMLGARRHYAVPRLLHEAGLLELFFTDSYIGNKPWLEGALRSIPARLRPVELKRLLGRKDSIVPAEKVTSFDSLGVLYAWGRRRAVGRSESSELYRDFAIRFNRSISKAGLGAADVVWGFNGAALELFETAKREGRRCVLEQTSLPSVLESSLLADEQQRWPGWEVSETDWTASLATSGREEAEWALADVILAGSEFVRNGLVTMGVAAEKVRVVSYGVDPSRFVSEISLDSAAVENGPLRVLFAGAVGVHKGVPDLLHALRSLNLKEIEAKFAGSIGIREEKYRPFRSWAEFLGPVPRQQMTDLFHWADVFVLPSIAEGSAVVTYEAMMSGCPIITTPNAGSIVRDGLDGFIVPIRAPDKLAEALCRYIDAPELLAHHKNQVRNGRERAGLERYKSDLVHMIENLCS